MNKKNKCKMGIYTTNEIILHGAILCWGYGKDQPSCKYIKECLEDHKDNMSTRRFNNIIKKINKRSQRLGKKA